MKLRDKAPKQVALRSSPNSRRMFLKSAGGLTLALPFLPSLLTSFAEKADAANSKPQRHVTFFTAFGGLQHKNWGGTNLPQTPFQLYSSQSARMNSISSLLQGGQLSPVINSNYQNLWPSMNLIMGNDQPYYIGHNRGMGLGGFVRSYRGQSWITDQGDFTTDQLLTEEFPTVDQVMGWAKGNGLYGLGLGGRRRFLNVATGFGSSSWGRDDYFSNDHIGPRDVLNTTAGVFSYLFGSVQSPQSANPLLNLVNEFWPSGRELINRLSGEDRQAVEKLFSLAQQASDDYSLPGPDTRGIVAPSGVSSGLMNNGTDLNTLADLITLAFQADVTRIVNFSCGMVVNNYDFHAISHSPSNANPDAGQAEMVQIHQNMSNNFFARLGNNLLAADPFDPSSSMLKNSLLLWTKENKAAHDMRSLPTLMLGEAGGRLATGNFTDLRDLTKPGEIDICGDRVYQGDLQNRLWASLFYAMNIPRSTYEISRGGTPSTVSLTSGYGHVLRSATGNNNALTPYSLSRIGEPWEFLMKDGVSWG